MTKIMSTKEEIQKKENRWTVLSDNFKIQNDFGFPKAFLAILINRGILKESDFKDEKVLKEKIDSFLNLDYEKELGDPFLLTDMDKAVNRLLLSLEKKEKIAVYGDYDVDGTTASAVLADILKVLKADFKLYIPSRQEEGYGLHKKALLALKEEGVDVVITVDCGIRSFDEAKYAKEIGLDLIITDHHEPQKNQNDDSKLKKIKNQQIPEAIAVINPKREDSEYPFKDLAGVGVAFKLACAILEGLEKENRLKDYGITKEYSKWLLDLVMIGTICDIVPLRDENRALAYFGFKVIKKTRRIGLKALVSACGSELSTLTTHNIGFQLGPRLNASGRLKHADLSLRILTSEDRESAQKDTMELNDLNTKRQDLTQKMLIEAREYLKNYDNKKIILLKDKNWPKGIVGIVASRLVEESGKPVILFEETEKLLEGSARSIKNFDILDALMQAKEHLVRFGGHKKAAGLSLKNEHFILLEEKLLKISDDQITEEDLVPEIILDTEIALSDVNQEFFKYIKKMEPFGYGNETPKFLLKNVLLKESKKVGKDGKHLKIVLSGEKGTIDGIFFNGSDKIEINTGDKVECACEITENEWMGQKKLEVRIVDMRSAN